VFGLRADYERGLNAQAVVDMLQAFRDRQDLLMLLAGSGGLLNKIADPATSIEEIKQKLREFADRRPAKVTGDTLQINDVAKIFELHRDREREFSYGIDEFDRANVYPTRGCVDLLLGATNTGKSWWLIDLAVNSVIHNRVLHVTLEMSAEEVIKRYWQRVLRVATRQGCKRRRQNPSVKRPIRSVAPE